MERISIKCASCSQNDFEVEKSIRPLGIKLLCKCGVCTPIAFFDTKEQMYMINGAAAMEQYNKSYSGDVEPGAAEAAIRCDSHKQLIYNRIMESVQQQDGLI